MNTVLALVSSDHPALSISESKHLIVTLLAVAAWLGVLVYAAKLSRRHNTIVPFIMMAGGAITVGFEPLVDNLGLCYVPEDYQWTLFTAFGRDMPVWAMFVYSAFFGGFAMMSWNHLKTGSAPRDLWKKYAAAMFINTALFETPALELGFYTYYGDQPWDFWGFPLWWPFVNTAGPLVAGAVAYVLDDVVRLDKKILIPVAFVLEPVFDGFSNGGAGLPTWTALHANVATFWVWVAGTVTIALGCLFVFVTVKAVELIQARTRPAALVARPEYALA